MWLIRVVTTVVLLEMAWASGNTQVKLPNNGYEDLVVGISDMIDERFAEPLIKAIKTSFTKASTFLFSATHQKLYFKDIKILLPKTWLATAVDEPAQNERFQDADIKVKPSNNGQPTTIQPGLCGEPGLYILLTPEFLMNGDSWLGPTGKVLTKEWARFRWGVFDELGFPNDDKVPLFYMDRTGGGTPELRPNTCTDKELKGTFLDRLNRNLKGCNLINGIPDEHCRFIPSYNQKAESSLMGSLEFDTVAEFCDDQSHNREAPTRHNLMCGRKSVWKVMEEHPDFSGLSEAQPGTDVTPKFTLVKEENANFALVLDYSGSMSGKRIESLQRSAQRWILHDVADGSTVGIVRFSSSGSLMSPMTKITNENDRRTLANKITIDVGGGTCIGCGLRTALTQLLVNRRNKVILLITDGQENADPKIPQVINEVVNSGAQVLTIAFGNSADPKMEELAMKTRGKSYTVFDTDDGRNMDDAFQGALTYQPGNTLTNTNIMIYEESKIASGTPFRKSFTIDATLGRNLQFRLDAKAGVSITANPVLTSPSGKSYNNIRIDSKLNLYTIDVAIVETGTWWWSVTLSGNTQNNVRVSITAQSKDPNTLPIITEAKIVKGGSQNVDPSKQRVIITARVRQGEYPVVGARVRAYITSPDNTDAAKEVDLLDHGVGADGQKGDGTYSRYFTGITAKGRYNVKAQVWDDGNAYINDGAFSQKRKRSIRSTRVRRSNLTRYDPYERPDYCCGSVVPFDPDAATKIGAFTRITGGGSFQVTVAAPSGDYLSPSPVRDLQITLDTLDRFNLTWTATGDDLDSGTVSNHEICMSTDHNNVLEGTCDESRNGTVRLDLSASMNMADVLLEAGEEVLLTVELNETLKAGTVYYIGLRAVDDSDRKSDVSNVAILAIGNDKSDLQDSQSYFLGISNFYLILIIVACISSLLLIVIATSICLVIKKRRKNYNDKTPLAP